MSHSGNGRRTRRTLRFCHLCFGGGRGDRHASVCRRWMTGRRTMTRSFVAAVALTSLTSAALLQDAVAQTIPKNPQIEIAYVAPHSDKYQPIYQRLKDLQVLETLQEFLAPLRLSRKIVVKTDEC